jgi:hypothetical protein
MVNSIRTHFIVTRHVSHGVTLMGAQHSIASECAPQSTRHSALARLLQRANLCLSGIPLIANSLWNAPSRDVHSIEILIFTAERNVD